TANDRPLGAQTGVANPPTAAITSPSFPATTYPTARRAMAAESRTGGALMTDAISFHRSTAQRFSVGKGGGVVDAPKQMPGGGEGQIRHCPRQRGPLRSTSVGHATTIPTPLRFV